MTAEQSLMELPRPVVPTTYVATFDTSYYLTMIAGAGGAVKPASGWFSGGTEVRISAIPTVGGDLFAGRE